MAKWWSARRSLERAAWLPLAVAPVACSDAEEAARVELAVVADSGGMEPLQTNLGYEVTFSEARLAVQDIQFAIAGEAHTASLWGSVSDWVVPPAHAHPGHYQGGEIAGELPGHFLLSWLPSSPAPLGMANLIVGSYQSANFTFARGEVTDGLAADDALLGHTAILRGEAAKDGQSYPFRAVIDAPDGRELVGAPFEVEIQSGSQVTLGIQLVPTDPLEGDTLLDDLDFAVLPVEAEGVLSVDPTSTDPALIDAYNALRRTLLTHDHFEVRMENGN